MLLALLALALVAAGARGAARVPPAVARWRAERARRAAAARRRARHALYDPGRERRAEQRARELLRSCVNDEEWGMYRDLGFIRVAGRHARRERDRDAAARPAYAYLVYPHKPIVAYVPESGQLLSEYCVEFPDLSGAGGRHRLPASDDVLAKWMALTSDEDRVIRRANMHLRGPPARPRPRAARPLAPRRVGAPARQPRAGSTSSAAVSDDLRSRSRVILDGPDRAQARAYLKGIGFDDDALQRPIVGIANTWTETMPCNFHLRRLAEKVKEGVRAAGGTPMEFNTVAISDGITMGTEGMKTSLVSREVIADSIELVARGHMFDAVVALSGCDKTIPGCVMALARLDVPSLMLYGGSIAPGRWRGKDVTIQDVFEGDRRARRRRPDRRGAHRPRGPRLARAPAPAAASSPPTRWRWPSRCSASRRWAARWCRPRTARRARSPRSAGGS